MNMIVPALAGLAALFAAAFAWAFLGWRTALARIAVIEEARAGMADFLRAQASESARSAADQVVERAAQTFQPVNEALKAFREQVEKLEKERAEQTGGLRVQISQLMAASTATRDEARRLTEALKGNSGRRGRWGEQTLRNVLEAAGMAGRFDYQEQVSDTDEDGARQRPDVLVRLPGGGLFVIDAKVSLTFADEADGDEDAQAAAVAARNAASIKAHLRQLAGKAYQERFQPSPDFVAMFVPGDAFLASALDREPELLTEAMDRRVVIVTPTTLFALCKAVAYGWRAEEQARNADQAARLGRELYKRLSVMGAHVAGMGKALDHAVGRYNQFVGSLESQVMVQARRFEDLHMDHEGRDLPELAPLEQGPRALSRPELAQGAAEGAPAHATEEAS